MRGEEDAERQLFSYVDLERRIPERHPLRPLKELCDTALKGLSKRFDSMYSKTGRPSIPPEQLLRALLLQVIYTIRSERQLVEQLDYNLLFRWFVGLGIDDPVWNHSVFTKNRDRLLKAEIAEAFFQEVLLIAGERRLLSGEHFTVDGTLVEAWAGLNSFRVKDEDDDPPDDPGNPTVNYHGQRRANDTHESRTDPEARLFRKGYGKEAKLFYMGHVAIENRNGLVTAAELTQATGRAEWEAAEKMLADMPGRNARITVGADKNYNTRRFVSAVRALGVTPHVCEKLKYNAIDSRTTRHESFRKSQKKRKRVEEVFGWIKTTGGLRKTRHRGKDRVGWMFKFCSAAYNLIRIRNLEVASC